MYIKYIVCHHINGFICTNKHYSNVLYEFVSNLNQENEPSAFGCDTTMPRGVLSGRVPNLQFDVPTWQNHPVELLVSVV